MPMAPGVGDDASEVRSDPRRNRTPHAAKYAATIAGDSHLSITRAPSHGETRVAAVLAADQRIAFSARSKKMASALI